MLLGTVQYGFVISFSILLVSVGVGVFFVPTITLKISFSSFDSITCNLNSGILTNM